MAVVLTATVQDTYTPPRVAVVVTGVAVNDELVIYREVDGERTTLRGGSFTADDTTEGLVDAECPFGSAITYGVQVNGVDADTDTATPTLTTGYRAVLSDAVAGLAALVGVADLAKKRSRPSTLFQPGGRNVVVVGEQGQWIGTLQLYTSTQTQAEALRALFDGSTGGIVQLRQLGTIPDTDDYLSVTDVDEIRLTGKPADYRRRWVCKVAQVNAWASTYPTAEDIANLASDPRATANAAVAGQLSWSAMSYGSGGGAGATTLRTGQVDGPAGLSTLTTYIRKTWSAAPSGNADTGFYLADDYGASGTDGWPVQAGEVYTISCYVRSSVAKTAALDVSWHTSAGTETADPASSTTSLTAATWTRLSRTVTVPSGAETMSATANIRAGGSAWANGNTLDGTGLMVVAGSTLYDYRDGNSPGWEWEGTANASPSHGWMLP